jgi:sulfofructosephosphate aldolase
MTQPMLDRIARPTGALAIVAMDQRESLRTMFDRAGAGRPPDRVLIDFKRNVADVLGPLASGFLLDREYGFDDIRERLGPAAGLILAADALTQDHGAPVEETGLDPVVFEPDFDLRGVVALKLLIIWRRDSRREERVELARRFVAAAAARGLLSVLEPIVRATRDEADAGVWDREEAILECAEELSTVGQSLYKVQVPLAGLGTPAGQRDASIRLGRSITGPWVVLSQGVEQRNFPAAVHAACVGGASGFLAGRALWSDVVGAPDVATALKERAVPRFEQLVSVVDRYARPWAES